MKKPQRFSLKSSRLFLALEQHDLTAVFSAIGNGETVDIQDRDGNTPLIRASFLGHLVIVAALLDFDPDVNAVNDLGWTGLHFAAQENHVGVAKLLASAGATVDSRDLNGNTPLWRAAFSNSKEMCSFLMSLGASVDTVNEHGVSPRELF